MRIALAAVRRQGPSRLVLAVPVAPSSTCQELKPLVDELVCLLAPEDFVAISIWYEDFGQTSDQEVCDLLEQAERMRSPVGANADRT
jgi:putative phosphoribosyl transferase